MHRILSALLFGTAMILMAACEAESNGDKYQAGKDYYVLERPVRTSNPDKVEVVELFWYGCGHCYKFSPIAHKWSATLPESAAYIRTPAIWDPRMDIHAKAYYTALALGVVDKVHPQIFAAYHMDKNRLRNEREIGDVFVAAGVDREKFSTTFNSFGIVSQAMQAKARTLGYRISGTPAIIVNGKYRISGQSAGSNDAMLAVAEFLIEKEKKLHAR